MTTDTANAVVMAWMDAADAVADAIETGRWIPSDVLAMAGITPTEERDGMGRTDEPAETGEAAA